MHSEIVLVKPVDNSTFNDLEMLFKSEEGPGPCWIMRKPFISKEQRMSERFNQPFQFPFHKWFSRNFSTNKEEKRDDSFLKLTVSKLQVQDNIPVGLLAYIDNVPVAWCSVAPHNTCFKQGAADTKNHMMVCLFVKRKNRNIKLSEFLIDQAKIYAKENGADYLETCMVNLGSPSYKPMELIKSFRKAGFEYLDVPGNTSNIMIFKL